MTANSNNSNVLIGRIAFRLEGEFWNAYYATPETMEDAIFLGGIAIMFVSGEAGKIRRERFRALMSDSVDFVMAEKFGVEVIHKELQPGRENMRDGDESSSEI